MKSEYITVNDEKLDNNNITSRYGELKEILEKYDKFDERIGIQNRAALEDELHKMYAELDNTHIACKNYREFEIIKNLRQFADDREAFNSLDLILCLVILTFIKVIDDFTYGEMDVLYDNTKNKLVPYTIARILEIINEG